MTMMLNTSGNQPLGRLNCRRFEFVLRSKKTRIFHENVEKDDSS